MYNLPHQTCKTNGPDNENTAENTVGCVHNLLQHFVKENINFAYPESVYVYNDIIEPNLVGDSYFGLLTSLHFPSAKGYHRFDYPLYKPV